MPVGPMQQWEYKTLTFQSHEEARTFRKIESDGWVIIAVVPLEFVKPSTGSAEYQVSAYKIFLKRPAQQP